MSGDRWTELDPQTRALLEGAKQIPDAPKDAQLRVASRLHRMMLGVAAGAAIADQIASPLEPSAPRDALAAAGTKGSVAAALLTAKGIGALVAVFALGGAAGAWMHASLATPEARIVYVERGAPAPTEARAREEAAPPVADPPSLPAPPTTASSSPPAASHPSTSSPHAAPASSGQLAAERALLDVARAALGRNDPAAALDATAAHERRFGSGILTQEREAIAIQSLVLLGRVDEARERAARFARRYPESLVLSAIEASLPPNDAGGGAP